MPIIVGGVVVEPPPTEQPPPVVLPEIGRASATYYDPSGTAWPLTDLTRERGYFTLADGVSGLGAAPIEMALDPHPRGGVRVRHIQPQQRAIVWPLAIFGDTHTEFTARWRQLGRAFTDTARYGPGILEIARPDGGRRHIRVYYQEGWEGQAQQGFGRVIDSPVVTLLCEDPYWVDPEPITEHREHSVGVGFLANFFQLSSGRTLGATTLTNPGDVITYPVWTITGPASLVTMTNTDTGESFAFDPNAADIGHGDLLAGEQVTIRTDPVQVRYQDGSVWTGGLNWPDAQMWGLMPGSTDVTFQLDGAAAGSAVDVAFTARYETA